jgi:protein SCO1/2
MVLSAALMLGACGGSASEETKTDTGKTESAASAEKRYDLKGTVVSLDKSNKSVTVNHDEIKGFMSAMTMAYSVKDPKALDGVTAGDLVTAKLVSNGDAYWLEDVKVVEAAKK